MTHTEQHLKNNNSKTGEVGGKAMHVIQLEGFLVLSFLFFKMNAFILISRAGLFDQITPLSSL